MHRGRREDRFRPNSFMQQRTRLTLPNALKGERLDNRVERWLVDVPLVHTTLCGREAGVDCRDVGGSGRGELRGELGYDTVPGEAREKWVSVLVLLQEAPAEAVHQEKDDRVVATGRPSDETLLQFMVFIDEEALDEPRNQ